MDIVMAGLPAHLFWAAVAVALLAGFVKGAIGFAMPLIMVSAFSSFLPPELALAGLILPTLATNLSQAFRQGLWPALASARKYYRYLISTVVFIVISAQFVHVLPQAALLLALGVLITAFVLYQLSGLQLSIAPTLRGPVEWVAGVLGGLYGGVSGIWGPPLIVYLLAINSEKQETIRVQGVVFLIGAVVLTSAHLQSGVLNASTLPFSAVLVLPAALGLSLGYAVQDRLDQQRFRRWTQILLLFTGLNLLRRAVGL
jgi:uncharacterized protein